MKRIIESFEDFISSNVLNEKSSLSNIGLDNSLINLLYKEKLVFSNVVEPVSLSSKVKAKNALTSTNNTVLAVKSSDDVILIRKTTGWSRKSLFDVFMVKAGKVKKEWGVSMSNALDFLTGDYSGDMYELENDEDPSFDAKLLGRGETSLADDYEDDKGTWLFNYMGEEYSGIIKAALNKIKADAINVIVPALDSHREYLGHTRNAYAPGNIKTKRGMVDVEQAAHAVGMCNYYIDALNGVFKDKATVNISGQYRGDVDVNDAQFVFVSLVKRKFDNYLDYDTFLDVNNKLTSFEKKKIVRNEVSKFLGTLTWEDFLEK